MTATVDQLIERLAATQLGLVTRAQLRRAGLSPDAIDGRVRGKRLRRVYRGVYRVGPLWQLLPSHEHTPVDVSVSRGNPGRRPGLRVHRVSLTADDVTSLEGIPVTSLPRTLVDLAAVLSGRDLERVLAQAERVHGLEQLGQVVEAAR